MALIQCPDCGKEISDQAPACLNCGRPVNKTLQEEPEAQQQSIGLTKPQKGEVTAAILIFSILAITLFCGFFHIVQSSKNGLFFVKKTAFTLSETFVNMDTITGVPFIVAVAKYPLAIRAMQKEGIIESDEAREARVQQEINEKVKVLQKQYEEQAKEMMRKMGY